MLRAETKLNVTHPVAQGESPVARRIEWVRARRIALAAVSPWVWFLVRDLGVPAVAVATALPVPVFAVCAVFLAVAASRRRVSLAAVGASWLVMGLTTVVGPWLPEGGPAPTQPLRLVMANVRSDNHHSDQGISHVLAQGADLAVLIEVQPRTEAALSGTYPFVTPVPGASKVVLSRYPVRLVDAINPDNAIRTARLEIEAPMGRLMLYVVHLGRPRARPDLLLGDLNRQREALDDLVRRAEQEEVPVLLVGDFNLSDRTAGYRKLHSRYRDATRSRLAGPTYVKPILWPELLRVDYVFIPRKWCSGGSRRFVIPGSDHRGVAAEVGACPASH